MTERNIEVALIKVADFRLFPICTDTASIAPRVFDIGNKRCQLAPVSSTNPDVPRSELRCRNKNPGGFCGTLIEEMCFVVCRCANKTPSFYNRPIILGDISGKPSTSAENDKKNRKVSSGK